MKTSALFALLLLGLATPARAGDRPVGLVVADMSPAGTPPACMRAVVREIRRREEGWDQPVVTRMGAGGARRLSGRDERDESPFMEWSVEDLQQIRERRRDDELDAIALVDCRPDRADVLVLSPSEGLLRFSVRGTPIDEPRAFWVGRTILLHARIGFGP